MAGNQIKPKQNALLALSANKRPALATGPLQSERVIVGYLGSVNECWVMTSAAELTLVVLMFCG